MIEIFAAALLGGGPPRVHAGYGPAPSHLVLEVSSDESGWARAVKLDCGPPGGGHPDPAGACAVLERIGADPAKIKPAALLCMAVYTPVTAEITGDWRGAPVKWSHTYGNECEMSRATGVLFKF